MSPEAVWTALNISLVGSTNGTAAEERVQFKFIANGFSLFICKRSALGKRGVAGRPRTSRDRGTEHLMGCASHVSEWPIQSLEDADFTPISA